MNLTKIVTVVNPDSELFLSNLDPEKLSRRPLPSLLSLPFFSSSVEVVCLLLGYTTTSAFLLLAFRLGFPAKFLSKLNKQNFVFWDFHMKKFHECKTQNLLFGQIFFIGNPRNLTKGKAKVVAAGWGLWDGVECRTSHLTPGWVEEVWIEQKLFGPADTRLKCSYGSCHCICSIRVRLRFLWEDSDYFPDSVAPGSQQELQAKFSLKRFRLFNVFFCLLITVATNGVT